MPFVTNHREFKTNANCKFIDQNQHEENLLSVNVDHILTFFDEHVKSLCKKAIVKLKLVKKSEKEITDELLFRRTVQLLPTNIDDS